MNRDKKGKSVLTIVNEYIVLDVETTGLSPINDEIIEFAAVHIKNGEIIDSFQTLIKPNYPVNSFITSLTGINNNMLLDAPKMNDVIQNIYDFIGENIIVGHNVNFDINFIYENCEFYIGKPLSNDFIDTMKLSRRLFKYLPNHKLETVSSYFNNRYYPSHRAMNDVLATYEFIEFCYKHILEHDIDISD